MRMPQPPLRNKSLFRISIALGLMSFMLFTEIVPLQAQIMMPIPPHSRTYTGYVRGYWFTSPVDFFMLGVRVPTDASSAQQGIEVLRIAAAPPRYAACTSNLTVLGYWPNVPGTAMIPMKVLVRQGEVIGILGSRWSVSGNFSSINSYSASANYTSNILGQPVVLKRFLWQAGIMYTHATCVSDNSPGSLGRVEMYYGPPCEVPAGNLDVSLVDASGQSQAYAEVPGTVWVKYRVSYPAGATDVSVTLNFHLVGDPNPVPAFSATVNDTKLAGQELVNQQMVNVPPGVQPGYYRVFPVVNSKNSCDEYQDSELGELTFMLVDPGTTPCIVWPGDVNNDGLVNFGDRKGLTNYIHDANLNSLWLNGPARYRSDAATNPLTYLTWVAQAAVPWYTPEGCYMDTDGNGVINNFDFIAMKMNWMRNHGVGSGKSNDEFSPNSFYLSQNFPNPFNPTTRINYSIPERSQVRIVVMDVLGREIETLVNGVFEEGARTVSYNAEHLNSGAYFVFAYLNGLESGLSSTKSIKMTLSK
jgi:hypothetical protein